MMYQQTTQVPNVIFDTHLSFLTESELKLLLIIIRQTFGWFDKTTGRRKTRDRISHGQFIKKTGLSRRVISKALKSLIEKGLVTVTCVYISLKLTHPFRSKLSHPEQHVEGGVKLSFGVQSLAHRMTF